MCSDNPDSDEKSPQEAAWNSLACAFRVRYRFPRPIAGAFSEVLFAQTEREEQSRVRWCANVTLRFLAALRQANHRADNTSSPLNAPSVHDLKLAQSACALSVPIAKKDLVVVRRLAGDYPARSVRRDSETLMRALCSMTALSRLRLAVVEANGLRILLGRHTEFVVSGAFWDHAKLLAEVGLHAPLCLDPETGRYLALRPLAVWCRNPRESSGHLYWLRRIRDDQRGYYLEEGEPGGPGKLLPIRGTVVRAVLSIDPDRRDRLSMPPVRFRDGQRIAATHQVYGLIWRGGVSDIYLARRLADGKPVVLKTFESQGSFDENYFRFLHESTYARRVGHPGVVQSRPLPFAGLGRVHEQDFIARGSLADYLENNGTLTAPKGVEIVRALLDILIAVHQAGVAHNDLKPDNILFEPGDVVRLIDFGIAVDLLKAGRTRRSGTIAGSRGYMAPELFRGASPTVQSDIFAVGVLLVEMLTGKVVDSVDAALAEKSVVTELHPFVRATLSRDPHERYPSAAAACNALQRTPVRDRRAVTLDVEGTLVTNGVEKQPRPHLAEFLRFCLETFDRVFVYTLLNRDRAAAVFDFLAEREVIPAEFTIRYEYVEWPRGRGGAVKDLRRCRFPIVKNLIVDDMESMIPEDQHHRWIRVPDYYRASNVDRGLLLVQEKIAHRLGAAHGALDPVSIPKTENRDA
jgi:hypothetical protein